MRISDWSSAVCSSDLACLRDHYIGGAVGQILTKATLIEFSNSCTFPFVAFVEDCDAKGKADLAVANLGVFGPCQISEDRRVGKECVSTCRSRWSPYQ